MSVKRCDANARKGTGTGVCDRPLDRQGYCDRPSGHLDDPTRTPLRAVDDPVALARAAGIIRRALARNEITLDDLRPELHHASGVDFCTIPDCQVCS